MIVCRVWLAHLVSYRYLLTVYTRDVTDTSRGRLRYSWVAVFMQIHCYISLTSSSLLLTCFSLSLQPTSCFSSSTLSQSLRTLITSSSSVDSPLALIIHNSLTLSLPADTCFTSTHWTVRTYSLFCFQFFFFFSLLILSFFFRSFFLPFFCFRFRAVD